MVLVQALRVLELPDYLALVMMELLALKMELLALEPLVQMVLAKLFL